MPAHPAKSLPLTDASWREDKGRWRPTSVLCWQVVEAPERSLHLSLLQSWLLAIKDGAAGSHQSWAGATYGSKVLPRTFSGKGRVGLYRGELIIAAAADQFVCVNCSQLNFYLKAFLGQTLLGKLISGQMVNHFHGPSPVVEREKMNVKGALEQYADGKRLEGWVRDNVW